jgi:hypothetical protein
MSMGGVEGGEKRGGGGSTGGGERGGGEKRGGSGTGLERIGRRMMAARCTPYSDFKARPSGACSHLFAMHERNGVGREEEG